VIDPEGHSYDRPSIEAWLSKHDTSPVTRSPLTMDRLAPNRALKEAIDAFKAKMAKEGRAFAAKVEPKPLQGTVKVNVRAVERKADDAATHDVLITLDAGEGKVRTPVDVVCVIDISGSMDSEATTSDESGKSESHGLSCLDIVKHAVSTVIHTLGPQDRCAIVSYSDSARVELEPLLMNPANQKKADDKLKSLQTEGSTNLWDGLFRGMEVLRANARNGCVQSVFLLTDGQPNVAPPRGHLEMLKRYKDEHKVNYTVNTFGFGYGLDSHLLDELATEGGGAYAFIPEATFVGTCFVNALSNLLVSSGADASLSVENINKSRLVSVVGGHPTALASWGAKVSLGTLQFGQPRTLVVRMDLKDVAADAAFANVALQYQNLNGETARVEASSCAARVATSPETAEHAGRALACEALTNIMKTMEKSGTKVDVASGIAKALSKTLHDLAGKDGTKNFLELIKDVDGQVMEATSRQDWWQKWGRHYLPSLCRAHQLAQCNNFKDPGVQVYGGPLFVKQRDVADAVFLKLPPPKPSRKKADGTRYAAPANMNAYYDSHAVCFSSDSLLTMADGSQRRCDEIKRGDVLFGGRVVRCVIETRCPTGRQSLVRLSETVLATPWHPIMWNGKWTFPIHVGKAELLPCDATWNFVLEPSADPAHHTVVVGGVVAATMGHGVVDCPTDVRSHTYWGRDVLLDLAQLPGWKNGHVRIEQPMTKRNQETNLVCKLVDVSIC
jgi:Mg-chelatase subunit ChlD